MPSASRSYLANLTCFGLKLEGELGGKISKQAWDRAGAMRRASQAA